MPSPQTAAPWRIYLLIDKPENYHEFAVAQADLGPMTKKQFLATLARPFKAMKA